MLGILFSWGMKKSPPSMNKVWIPLGLNDQMGPVLQSQQLVYQSINQFINLSFQLVVLVLWHFQFLIETLPYGSSTVATTVALPQQSRCKS